MILPEYAQKEFLMLMVLIPVECWYRYLPSGCILSVEFAGRQTNSIFSFLHVLITSTDRWLDKLSPSSIFFPGWRRATGRKAFSNHSPKRKESNHPEGELVYTDPFGPPVHQLGYTL